MRGLVQFVLLIGLFVLLITVVSALANEAQKEIINHNTRSTRLRHIRHLGERRNTPVAEALRSSSSRNSPNTVVTGDESRLTVRDNHKPVFANCSHYRPEVAEEQSPGAFVIQVQAVDRDPLDAGGTVVYSFVLSKSEQKKFNINPSTGMIHTNHMFDRDETSREKEVYLTVRATDNGLPQLDDVCTFKVIITDINDNSPVFDKVYYVESVPQDLQNGSEVMRVSASDVDDGNNSLVYYSLESTSTYFHIDRSTGIIYLDKAIDKDPGYHFRLNATATDQGEGHNSARVLLEIRVVESHKKPPTFSDDGYDTIPVRLLENRTIYQEPIVILTANSNIQDEPELQFVLVPGRTEQTNTLNTFVMESDGSRALIKQGKPLDYETIKEYILTVRVQNKYSLAAERHIQVQIEDVNDNIPYFSGVLSGHVSENEPPGTPVMQVRAFDSDGTTQHNQVTYALDDNFELFQIDHLTGNITTLKEFDREDKDHYNVKVYAKDSSPSSIMNNGLPNRGEQVFSIEITDKNDNPPRFTQKAYVAEAISEDANQHSLVTEVKALDNDTASPVRYSIIEGNTNDAFYIKDLTGEICVNNQLDYETLTSYSLKVRAFDGKYEDYTKVEIKIENVNDNPPVFMPHNGNITIFEEEIRLGCIVEIIAYDPDIPNRDADQKIVYFVVDEAQRKVLTINKTGCLSLIKPLDRDPPNGFPKWQVHIAANDEDGNSPTSLRNSTEVVITLTDINDNAPFLDMPHPVVWSENRPPGVITELVAKDYDSEENGFPFIYKISPSASEDIKNKFGVAQTNLLAKVTFDREQQKVYYIPIQITDSGDPPQTGTSTLTVIIGDENDNPMKPGSSSIFVYNYEGEAPNTDIGRVYVDDPDDWDLPDKQFRWKSEQHDSFSLNQDTGMITMLHGTTNGSFLLEFMVAEENAIIARHEVDAIVNVTVKEIPEEAVDKSGSIRFTGITAEEFVAPMDGGPSKRQLLAEHIASILNTSIGNVDVFTVLHSPKRNGNQSLLDVRFSAHGSPYYYAEKLNRLTTKHQDAIERELGASMLMVNIDECLLENDLCQSLSCTNFLNKQTDPYVVNTNTTSFVGVNAVVEPLCTCSFKEPVICLNGGTPVGDTCECVDGYEGPRCEVLGISFNGDGWALYPPLQACEESHLSLDLKTNKDSGLVFYVGPTRKNIHQDVQDFMSLEVQNGYPVLLVDYGTGTVKAVEKETRLNDGKTHHVEVIWSVTGIELNVDNCKTSACFILRAPEGVNKFLNVNGPLQVGGAATDLLALGKEMNWTHKPTDTGFAGCIRNLTYNAKTYNLGMPSDSKNAYAGCTSAIATAVSFGIDKNFLVAILVCIAILLILLLAVVVHRRKTDDMYKDMDDIRENIITYEDEGGGEIDAGFDMNVLRMYDSDGQPMLSKPIMKDHLQTGADEVPDICGFLDGKKKICDNDPETNPFDDVRHYAYEGDGNTTGSLSSLASGTDEGDLNFDYLSNFGPRFRKLADMYGEDPSDDDDNFNNPASESWC